MKNSSALPAKPPAKAETAVQILARYVVSSVDFVREQFGVEPDTWQLEALQAWDRGDARIAMKACKGPGKTAVLAWIGWHFLLTRPDAKVPCTSISGDNLSDGLWAEFAKWQGKSPLLKDLFEWQKTRIIHTQKSETWFASARSWSKSASSEQQADTLAGLHADYILFLIDEVGGIPQAVMVAAEAVMATEEGEARIVMAGNPTQRSGPLWRACNADRRNWTVITITGDPASPRRASRISVDWAQKQIDSYGADNPWVLANVFGEFPPAGALNFIAEDVVSAARNREALGQMFDAFVIGVDVARFGDDESVIYFRKGRDGRTHPPLRLRNLDTMQLASRVAEKYRHFQADAVFVDGGGPGGGVVDRLRQLRVPVIEVQFGAKPDGVVESGQDSPKWANKSAEMWGAMREWLKGGAIPDDQELSDQLTNREYDYKFVGGADRIALESKEDMKSRGVGSPDIADALALTFAYSVMPAEFSGGEGLPRHRNVAHSEFDPFRDSDRERLSVVTDFDPYRNE